MNDLGSVAWAATIALVLLVLYMLTHPEKVEQWGANVTRIFAKISQRAERATVALNIEGVINSFAKDLRKEIPLLAPRGIKIEWVKQASEETILRDGEIVIRMENHENQPRNLVHATMVYITKAIIPEARPYTDTKVIRSVDFTIARKLFLEKREFGSLQYFNEEIFTPEIDRKPEIKRYCTLMHRLDEQGYFTRLLLSELSEFGIRLQVEIPSEDLFKETTQFVDSLGRLATKQPGVDINPTFVGNKIQIGIVLIGRPEMTMTYGIDPYVRYIEKCLQDGIHTIYILARGTVNMTVARVVARHFEPSDVVKKWLDQEFYLPFYRGRRTKALCICFKPR